MHQGRIEDAVRLLSELAETDRDNVDLLRPLAQAYLESDQLLPALRIYDHLAELGSADAKDWYAMGAALFDLGEHVQAVGALERSLKLDRHSLDTQHRLAWAYYRLGKIDLTARLLETIARRQPSLDVLASLATIIPSVPGASQRKIRKVRERFAEALVKEVNPDTLAHKWPGFNDKPRIGYVSSWFNSFNYMKPVWGLINQHNRERYRIYIYMDCNLESEMIGYVPHERDCLRTVSEMNNQELAARIRDDRIDTLVDLNAYSTQERLGLYVLRPAPVQVAWFNMYATSGLQAFDYIVGDDETVRHGEERFYTEQVERLPLSYLTFDVRHPVPAVVDPPCLENGWLTFGSLIVQYKITPQMIDVWAAILRKTKDSRLFLANTAMRCMHNRDWLTQCFVKRGIHAERIIISGPDEHYRYLENYNRIDIALDTWPYNGGTTTTEALWQGVPVLTKQGDRWAARTSQTIILRTHLDAFVASSTRDLIKRAVQLAKDRNTPRRLQQLREEMRERLSKSSACDTASMAKAMEAFYERVLSRNW